MHLNFILSCGYMQMFRKCELFQFLCWSFTLLINPTGRAFISHCCVYLWNLKNSELRTTIIKLFTLQLQLSVLPAGCDEFLISFGVRKSWVICSVTHCKWLWTNTNIHGNELLLQDILNGPKYTVQSNEYTIAGTVQYLFNSCPRDTKQWTSACEQPRVAQS